ncbi:MAG: ABC transporter substrate-binding protein [Alphaproteobacteria bacterium]|nr:ABC transporter substrate-binding protein [Alphaproteobacteria bacterium]
MTTTEHSAGACACGETHTADDTTPTQRVVGALLTGLFPQAASRRRFLRAVGAGTALAALESLLPVDALTALAQERVVPEKTALSVGFLPITCATPLIMAEHMGLYAKHGLQVSLAKVPGIALIRDKLLNGELDASEQVMPVPISATMGMGSIVDPTSVLTIQNQHGNSLVLAMKHKDNRDPKNWKGFKFAVPFDQSHQAMLLRYYLAEHGIDPDQDVQFRVVPPSEYVSNLRTGNVDGFFGGEPGGQRAVYEGAGFLHLLSSEIWPGHPCCAFVAREAWIKQHPNSFIAIYRAVVEASVHVSQPGHRVEIAGILAPANYLNQPAEVIEQVISGRYADGLGNVRQVADRIVFDPFPHPSMAVWLMTQLKRWGFIKGDVDYQQIAARVMLVTEARQRLAELGLPAPAPDRIETILGKPFDPSQPEAYIRSFAIRRV